MAWLGAAGPGSVRLGEVSHGQAWHGKAWTTEMTDFQFLVWRLAARIRHWFGLHTWVPSERWDLHEAGLIEIVGYVCWRCEATRRL